MDILRLDPREIPDFSSQEIDNDTLLCSMIEHYHEHELDGSNLDSGCEAAIYLNISDT